MHKTAQPYPAIHKYVLSYKKVSHDAMKLRDVVLARARALAGKGLTTLGEHNLVVTRDNNMSIGIHSENNNYRFYLLGKRVTAGAGSRGGHHLFRHSPINTLYQHTICCVDSQARAKNLRRLLDCVPK